MMSFRVRVALKAAKIMLSRGESLEDVFKKYSNLTPEEKGIIENELQPKTTPTPTTPKDTTILYDTDGKPVARI